MLSRWLAAIAFISLLTIGASAQAVAYKVSIDTFGIAGTLAELALDFIDGGPPSNSFTVADFATDGTLGASVSAGGVTGVLPSAATLTDSAFFNELLTSITLGSSLSFVLTPSANAPDLGSLPDSFTAYLLDAISGLSLFPTSDPSGADALLQFDIDGSAAGAPAAYSAPGGEVRVTLTAVPAAVPEPSALLLASLGLVFTYLQGRRKSRTAAN